MSAITIIHGPENVTAYKCENATFPCWYNGTFSTPSWSINGTLYTTLNLPDRHYFSTKNLSLTVVEVQLSDNATEYQCLFFDVSSEPGVLTVIEAPQNGKNNM